MAKRQCPSTAIQTYSVGRGLTQLLEAVRKPYSVVARMTGMADAVAPAVAVVQMQSVVGKQSAEVPRMLDVVAAAVVVFP